MDQMKEADKLKKNAGELDDLFKPVLLQAKVSKGMHIYRHIKDVFKYFT